MMEVVPVDELEDALRNRFGVPIRLRTFVQGRMRADPARGFERAGEARELEGLGSVSVWAGYVDEVPFTLTGLPREDAFGFELSLPVMIQGGRVDIEGALRLASALPGALARCERLYFDSIPWSGEGHGVFELDDATPIFGTEHEGDARRIHGFVDAGHASRYSLRRWTCPPAWLVVGPIVGNVVSRLEVTSSKESAARLAERWSRETGLPHSVMQQLSG